MPEAKRLSLAEAKRDILPILAEATKRGETVTFQSLKQLFFPNGNVPRAPFGMLLGTRRAEYGIRRHDSGKTVSYDLTPDGLAKIVPLTDRGLPQAKPPDQLLVTSDTNESEPNQSTPAPSTERTNVTSVDNQLQAAYEYVKQTGCFDAPNNEVACKWVMRAIAQRLGQSDFRDQLLSAYQEKCAVTDCSVSAVLEAAHIKPFCEEQTYLVPNGILLRSDIHTLFDRYLMGINPADFTVAFAEPAMRGKYKKLNGKPIRVPTNDRLKPSQALLQEHWEEFQRRNGTSTI